MAYRFKTREEFKETGWSVPPGEDSAIYPPGDNSQGRVDVAPQMFKEVERLSFADIERICAGRDTSVISIEGLRWSWTKHMFTDGNGVIRASMLCNCSWNKHPIWCKCN